MKKEEQQGAQQPQALDISGVFPEADCPLCYDVGRVAVSDPADTEIDTVACPECQGALGDARRVIQEMRARRVNHGRNFSDTLHTWADRLEASLQAVSQKGQEARDWEMRAQKYDDVLLPFLGMMRAELHANSGKGDRPVWLAMDVKTALLEVFYHMGKLQKAVRDNDSDEIREHSADVAIMSMMLADICGVLPTETSTEQPERNERQLFEAEFPPPAGVSFYDALGRYCVGGAGTLTECDVYQAAWDGWQKRAGLL